MEEEVTEAVCLGLPVLTPVEVKEQLFRAVLRCGHFNLVQKYMSGNTTPSIPTTSNPYWTPAGSGFIEPVVESAKELLSCIFRSLSVAGHLAMSDLVHM